MLAFPKVGPTRPGYFAGTRATSLVELSGAFVAYLNRCRSSCCNKDVLLPPSAIYCIYVPNLVRLKDDPAGVPGTTTVNEEVLVGSMGVKTAVSYSIHGAIDYIACAYFGYRVLSCSSTQGACACPRGRDRRRNPRP